MPNRQIWQDCLRVLKPGSFGLIFSSIWLMHRLMVDVEESGFLIKDVLFWAYLNGMPKSRNLGLEIDKELGVESKKVGKYRYVQGYQKGGADNYSATQEKYRYEPASELGIKYKGAGLGIKPAYEPVILVQKPTEKGLTVAQNIQRYGTGALNLEDTRIPYATGETKVGHHPHPKGRVTANVLRTDEFEDGYNKMIQESFAVLCHLAKLRCELLDIANRLVEYNRFQKPTDSSTSPNPFLSLIRCSHSYCCLTVFKSKSNTYSLGRCCISTL